MKILVPALCLFITLSNTANADFSICNPQINFDFPSQMTNKQKTETQDVFLKVNSLLSTVMKCPTAFNVKMSIQGDQFYYLPEENTIYMSLKYTSEENGTTRTKSPEKTRPLFAHEYAHLWLMHNLSLDEHILTKMEAQLKAQLPMAPASDLLSKNKIKDQLRLVFAKEYILGALHELFADVVTVGVYGNPDVMEQALLIHGESYTSRYSAMRRNFKRKDHGKYDYSDFLTDDSIDEKSENPLTDEKMYMRFNAFRNYIWKYFLSNKTYNKQEIIKSFLTLINHELEYAMTQDLDYLLDDQELNTRFIQNFDITLETFHTALLGL